MKDFIQLDMPMSTHKELDKYSPAKFPDSGDPLIRWFSTSSAKFADSGSVLNFPIPADISQIHPNSVVHGYICNLIETGCFVRFLGRLTGFSPIKKATDDKKINLLEAYYKGQSVRCNVLDISSETDASFIQDYFLMKEKIDKLLYLGAGGSDLKWGEGFSIGTIVDGKVDDVKEVGVVVNFEKYDDVFGFITNYQLAGTVLEKGSAVKAMVLDLSLVDGFNRV
ncbi:hypothetical protein K1719_001797 [Acacia pycnantha]|nr:hypothetical protein K1719_001797 [Acacia pycnantha]